jgi:hypothetical protein
MWLVNHSKSGRGVGVEVTPRRRAAVVRRSSCHERMRRWRARASSRGRLTFTDRDVLSRISSTTTLTRVTWRLRCRSLAPMPRLRSVAATGRRPASARFRALREARGSPGGVGMGPQLQLKLTIAPIGPDEVSWCRILVLLGLGLAAVSPNYLPMSWVRINLLAKLVVYW